MPIRFHKYKVLLDENMPIRKRLPLLNGKFDVKHVSDDLHKASISDLEVYKEALKQNRIIVTRNIKDFKPLANKSKETGVIGIPPHAKRSQIDKKLVALLSNSTSTDLYGKFTALTED